MKYLILLRGINVGGNNIIKMERLRQVLHEHGYQNVATYIQSGNVVLESKLTAAKLTSELEKLLADAFHYRARVVVVSLPQLVTVLAEMPRDWKTNHDIRCYIAFVKEPTTAKDVAEALSPREGIDFVATGKRVVYMTTLTSGLTKSGFTKIVGTKIYQDMTIRNLNTTQKLLALMEKTS